MDFILAAEGGSIASLSMRGLASDGSLLAIGPSAYPEVGLWSLRKDS
jgi:hypothetical protein